MKKLHLSFSIFFAILFLIAFAVFFISLKKIEDKSISTAITMLFIFLVSAIGFTGAINSWHGAKDNELETKEDCK